MPFDIVVNRNAKSIGIEVSFQVTTNSTIERKSGQAADRLQSYARGWMIQEIFSVLLQKIIIDHVIEDLFV